MKMDVREKYILCLVIVLSLPLLAGWEDVNLGEYLKSVKKSRGREDLSQQSLPPAVSPYSILEKTTAAFGALKTVRVDMETWIEDPSMHIKSVFTSDIQNSDNYRTNGRIAVSLLVPGSVSTSQWVQSYELRGIPFTWDLEKREWVEKELDISGSSNKKVLQYTMLSSLFTINDAAVDAPSIRFMGEEQRGGRECFVLQYGLARKQFERWNTTGDISVKVWIDNKNFLPVFLRSEGKIGSLYILQSVKYGGFNAPVELNPPASITGRVQQKKDALRLRVGAFAASIRSIRGWTAEPAVALEFNDRIAMRDYFSKQIEKEYSAQRFEGEGVMMKWLGFLPEEADYRENMLNMQVSSTAALYDPDKKTILMGDWLYPPLAEAVLVHELVHAFQDTTVGLDKFMNPEQLSDNLDTLLASRSLLEGEATAVMMEYLLRKDGKSFKEMGDVFSFIEDTLLKKSQYMRENIVYNIYGYGANFIQNYLKQKDWNSLEALFKIPPVSMRQVMHPYAYESGVSGGGKVDSVELDVNVPRAWEKYYDARIGEFFIFLSLRQFLDKASAERSATGWKNDRIRIYGQGDRRLIVFVTKWDNPKESAEFSQAYVQWMKARFPGASVRTGKAGIFLKTAGKDKFVCTLNSDMVLIVWGKGLEAGEFASLINKMNVESQTKT